MAVFPLPVADGIYSLRFYQTGTGTAAFSGNQWLFAHPVTGLTAWSKGIRVTATGGDMEISFDGTNVHGKIKSGATAEYWDRCEAGIAIRGNTFTFIIEAW